MNQKLILLLLLFTIVQYVKSDQTMGKLPCSCRASIKGRIVNGRLASSRSYPWLISIQSRGNDAPENLHGCSASIINGKHRL